LTTHVSSLVQRNRKTKREENGKKKFLFQAIHEPGFRREGEGPKNTKEKKVAVLYVFIICKKLGWKLTQVTPQKYKGKNSCCALRVNII
jgi:hypothetical protein